MVPKKVLAICVTSASPFADCRSVGKSLMEFKRGMQGIESEIHTATGSSEQLTSNHSAAYEEMADDYQEPSAPKFEPPTTAPTEESNSEV